MPEGDCTCCERICERPVLLGISSSAAKSKCQFIAFGFRDAAIPKYYKNCVTSFFIAADPDTGCCELDVTYRTTSGVGTCPPFTCEGTATGDPDGDCVSVDICNGGDAGPCSDSWNAILPNVLNPDPGAIEDGASFITSDSNAHYEDGFGSSADWTMQDEYTTSDLVDEVLENFTSLCDSVRPVSELVEGGIGAYRHLSSDEATFQAGGMIYRFAFKPTSTCAMRIKITEVVVPIDSVLGLVNYGHFGGGGVLTVRDFTWSPPSNSTSPHKGLCIPHLDEDNATDFDIGNKNTWPMTPQYCLSPNSIANERKIVLYVEWTCISGAEPIGDGTP